MVSLTVNGSLVDVETDGDAPLLYALRNDLGLKGTRYGCGIGSCGACNVLLDGRVVQSCDTPVSAAVGREVTTIEGLADEGGLSRLQQAFIDEQAGQCGYCLSGILVSATALLEADPAPSRAAIRSALDGNLCRCGVHDRIVRAVERAATRPVTA